MSTLMALSGDHDEPTIEDLEETLLAKKPPPPGSSTDVYADEAEELKTLVLLRTSIPMFIERSRRMLRIVSGSSRNPDEYMKRFVNKYHDILLKNNEKEDPRCAELLMLIRGVVAGGASTALMESAASAAFTLHGKTLTWVEPIMLALGYLIRDQTPPKGKGITPEMLRGDRYLTYPAPVKVLITDPGKHAKRAAFIRHRNNMILATTLVRIAQALFATKAKLDGAVFDELASKCRILRTAKSLVEHYGKQLGGKSNAIGRFLAAGGKQIHDTERAAIKAQIHMPIHMDLPTGERGDAAKAELTKAGTLFIFVRERTTVVVDGKRNLLNKSCVAVIPNATPDTSHKWSTWMAGQKHVLVKFIRTAEGTEADGEWAEGFIAFTDAIQDPSLNREITAMVAKNKQNMVLMFGASLDVTGKFRRTDQDAAKFSFKGAELLMASS